MRSNTLQLKQEFHRNAEKLQEIWECGLRDAAVPAWSCHLSKQVHFLVGQRGCPMAGSSKEEEFWVGGSVLHEESRV